MSDTSTPTPSFDLSILGIGNFPNDADVTPEAVESSFSASVQEALRNSSLNLPPISPTGDGSPSTPATDDDEEVEDTGQLSAGTDEATAPTDADAATIASDDDDTSAEGEHTSPPSFLEIPLSDGSTFQLTQDHASSLLALASWAQSIPEQTRYAFAAIESGQAVAIPRQDYSAFLQWQQSRPASTSLADELEDISPDAAARIRELEARVAAIPDPSVAQQQAEAQARYDRVNSLIPQTLSSYMTSRQLSESQMNERLNTALSLNLIATMTEQQTVRAPDGRVIREPDHAAIIARAMDMVAGGGFVAPLPSPSISPSPSIPSPPQSSPPPAPSSTLPSVGQRAAVKKAKASSLATAPSSAVSQPRSTEPLSLPDMTAVVAEALKNARNGQ